MKSSQTPSGGHDPSVLRTHLSSIICATLAVSFSIGSIYGPLRGLEALTLMDDSYTCGESLPNDGWTFEASASPPVGKRDSEFAGPRRAFSTHVNGLGTSLDGSAEPPGPRPHGVSLVVDIRNVAFSFLSDEDALGHALDEFAVDAGLTLVSRHCRGMPEQGFSCVGILTDSHVSFHTWPLPGVISFDLVTFGKGPTFTIVPFVEKHFGIQRKTGEGRGLSHQHEDPTKVVTKWCHQLRGFRTQENQKGALDQENELSFWVLTPFDQKFSNEIFSTTTPFQRIDVWEILYEGMAPSYQDMLAGPYPLGDKRYLTPQFTSPERVLFLDGIAKVGSDNERVYYEAMVHPPMFAHISPRRVAIVGGGEGVIIREILKHNTIEKIVVIEKDPVLVDVSRKHFETSCDCRNFEGVAPVCFDDSRVEMRYEDAIGFFMKNFDKDGMKGNVEKFDVVFLGVLDPQSSENPVYAKEFLDATIGSLTEHGIIAATIGFAPVLQDPPDHRGLNKARDGLFRHLETRLSSMLVYEEARCGWDDALSFLVGCASRACRNHWYAKNNIIDAEINKRILKSTADLGHYKTSLVHYDGGTQRGYGYTPKGWENVYCRREPEPVECKYRRLDPGREVVNWGEGFEVRREIDGLTGVFATRDIDKGSYVLGEDHAASIFVTSDVHKHLENGSPSVAIAKDFLKYAEKYGRESLTGGPGSLVMDLGTSILVKKAGEREGFNVARISKYLPSLPTYSPVFERNRRMFDVLVVATRDILKGEEVIVLEG